MVRHNEHSFKFLQLTDFLHVIQVTLTDIRPDKSIIANAITFILRETVRISKCSK